MEEQEDEDMDVDGQENTGVILCLGVPKGVEFGLDMTIWQGMPSLVFGTCDNA